MSHYIITYYFPAGMFVIVSWISFLVPPESVPGRMTILVTVFLVLVNIFNSITSNIPRADGLTAIESFVIICIVFVFGALIGKRLSEYILSNLKHKLGDLSAANKHLFTRCNTSSSSRYGLLNARIQNSTFELFSKLFQIVKIFWSY